MYLTLYMCVNEGLCVYVSICPCVSPEGLGGHAAAAFGPSGGGELPGHGGSAAGQLRVAVFAELRGEAGGPGGGAAC